MSDSAENQNVETLHGVTVLVVEDEQRDADRVIQVVKSLGGQSLHTASLQGARHLISEHQVDLIVLDRMLAGGEHGLDLLSWFRQIEAPVPQVLVASRLATSDDHILGLDSGADDYINKPFDPRELAARIRALQRRADSIRSPVSVLVWGKLEIRTLNEVALWDGDRINLRPQSFSVLSMLANLKGEYLSREALWREVWKKNKFLPPQDTVINTEISRLRGSLKALPDGPQVIAEDLGFRLVIED